MLFFREYKAKEEKDNIAPEPSENWKKCKSATVKIEAMCYFVKLSLLFRNEEIDKQSLFSPFREH